MFFGMDVRALVRQWYAYFQGTSEERAPESTFLRRLTQHGVNVSLVRSARSGPDAARRWLGDPVADDGDEIQIDEEDSQQVIEDMRMNFRNLSLPEISCAHNVHISCKNQEEKEKRVISSSNTRATKIRTRSMVPLRNAKRMPDHTWEDDARWKHPAT